ncbi:putative protein tag-76, partial [Trichinella nelsoni]
LPSKLLLLFWSKLVSPQMSKESEDTNVAADELSQLRLKELVKRPGYGTVGKPIKLACNYFPLIKLQKGDIVVNRYHIDIQHPCLKLNWFDFNLLSSFIVVLIYIFGDPFKLAYDGKSTLFTVDKLHLKPVSEKADTEKFSFKTVRENIPSELSILMKFTGLVHLDFRNAEAGLLDEREKGPIQFLDILFAQGRSSPLLELSKSFKAVRNSFYFIPQGAGMDVKYGLDLWRGLFISARVVDCFRPAINIDVSHSCFYKHQSLINLICDILNGDEREVRFHPNQLRSNTQLQPEHLSLLIPELKGVCIHTTHRNQDRIYRIKNILSTAVSMKFEKDGKEVSVAEYFCDAYGPLKYPNLPLVQVGSKSKPIYFPVELCQVANCQRYNKKLKACQTTSIIRFASTDAPTRILKCIDMVKKSNFSNDPFLKSFGVQIKAEPMIVSGRVLPPPRLEYGKGNGGRKIILTPKDGAWNSNEFKFFESASCESFGFVSFLPPHKAPMLQEFCLQIVRTCRSTGIEMPDSPKFYEQARKNDTVEMVLKRIADKCDRYGIKCDLVFVALFSSEQYAQVKSCGDITFGLVTQCLLPRTIIDVAVKKSYSTMLNIAMKINMKIGGINTKLLEDEVLDNYLYKNNALVIGVDVVHPSAVETHLPSIASVVAEYFRDVYGPLKYPNFPLVQVGSKKKPIYFPVELCQVAKCQRYNKKLKACQTTSIIRFASTDAPTRILKCIDMVKKSNFNNDPFLKSFGVQIKAEPMIVSGRVLSPPRLEYGKGSGGRQIILTPKDGAWNSNEFKFFESASCESFGFVSFLPPHKASMLQEFCLQIVRTCRSTGIEMPDSPKFYEQARKNDTVEMVLKRIADKCDRDGMKCDLVFVALFSSEQYGQVKSCGDITFGLVTQCVLPKTISDVAIKKSYSTMLNIAMKINMKIGGINAKLLKDEVLDNYLYKNNTFVIGVDVVHPSAVETYLPSVAAVVENVDVTVTKFNASVKIQSAMQELITDFVDQFSERIMEYSDVNGSAPKNIIVFPDGISKSQFKQVLEEELLALRRACKKFALNYRPLITFILVQKGHHARFVCYDKAAAQGQGKTFLLVLLSIE